MVKNTLKWVFFKLDVVGIFEIKRQDFHDNQIVET